MAAAQMKQQMPRGWGQKWHRGQKSICDGSISPVMTFLLCFDQSTQEIIAQPVRFGKSRLFVTFARDFSAAGYYNRQSLFPAHL
jgi:hypothetical protein